MYREQDAASVFFFHFELQEQDWQAVLIDSGHFARCALNTSQHMSDMDLYYIYMWKNQLVMDSFRT